MGEFTRGLWESIKDIFSAIMAHPFVTGLTDGSLRVAQFKAYVVQDALYLLDFSKSLAILASKPPRENWTSMFSEHARVAIEVEKSLHNSFFRDWE